MTFATEMSTAPSGVEDCPTLSALERAGVILTSLRAVVRVAPFGSYLQVCLGLAQVVVDNVKNMQSFRASEDKLSMRIAETLNTIVDALRTQRSRPDARLLKQDFHPLEVTMEEIAVFTNKQRAKKSLQRFMDAREDLKKVQEFHSDLDNSLLQLQTKLALNTDSSAKSIRSAQKEGHELLYELGHRRVPPMVNEGDITSRRCREPNCRDTVEDAGSGYQTSRGAEGRYEHDRSYRREPTVREARRNDPVLDNEKDAFYRNFVEPNCRETAVEGEGGYPASRDVDDQYGQTKFYLREPTEREARHNDPIEYNEEVDRLDHATISLPSPFDFGDVPHSNTYEEYKADVGDANFGRDVSQVTEDLYDEDKQEGVYDYGASGIDTTQANWSGVDGFDYGGEDDRASVASSDVALANWREEDEYEEQGYSDHESVVSSAGCDATDTAVVNWHEADNDEDFEDGVGEGDVYEYGEDDEEEEEEDSEEDEYGDEWGGIEDGEDGEEGDGEDDDDGESDDDSDEEEEETMIDYGHNTIGGVIRVEGGSVRMEGVNLGGRLGVNIVVRNGSCSSTGFSWAS